MDAYIIPIEDILDLHTFNPKEIPDLIEDYIDACMEKGIFSVRIIHGKGQGFLKKRLHGLLSKNPNVISFQDAPGNWGATLAELKRGKKMRWKAEQAIRQAAAELGNVAQYRIDKIRLRAGLHRKVFDKTILDMARVGTIQLFSSDDSDMNGGNMSEMVWQGVVVYISFVFLNENQYDPVSGKLLS